MLDVRRLRLLRDLAHHGTIAAVAAAASYTPSAVSQQLSALEKEAGVALLMRTGRRVALTPAGAALVEHAEAVLAALERAGTALGVAISVMINIVEVDTVLLDGSYALLAAWLTDHIEAEIRRRVLTSRWVPIEVRAAPIGPDSAVIGAALVAIDAVRQDPVSWLDLARA